MSDLERLIDRACRAQPDLPAPPTLVARVIGELERRAALPWWRRSFAYWPLAVRLAFVAACVLLAASLFTPPLARFASTAERPFAWAHQFGASASVIDAVFNHVGADLAHSLAPHWFYSTGLGIGGLYLLLAGLCAMTYRTLYVSR